MSRHDFDSALEQCLRALEQGAQLEACLARYPKYAERLRPLLSLAGAVRRVPPAKPSDEAQAAAWQRFYQRAFDVRGARWRPALGWLKPLAIAAALVLAFVAAGGGTIYAASKSLPDSPLYRVKLATEEVRLWLAFSDEAKADRLLDQAETRSDEIRALVRKGKPIPSSVLSALGSRTSRAVRRLEGPDQTGPRWERARRLAQQHEELLLALWENVEPQAQGRYTVTLVTLHNARLRLGLGAEAPRIRPEELALGILHISGIAQPLASDVWRIGDLQVGIDERTLGDGDITAGSLATIIAARGADGRLRALSLSTSPQPGEERRALISGTVEDVAKNQMRVAGHTVAITGETLLKLSLRRGLRVEVTARATDGEIVAIEVRPLPQEEAAAADLLSYEGSLEGEPRLTGETNRWLVGGESFVVTSATELDAQAGEIALGARVRVEAWRQGGELKARRIVVLTTQAGADEVGIEGVFQGAFAQGRWQVSGIVVQASGQSLPPPGASVLVKGRRQGTAVIASQIITLPRPGAQQGLVKIGGLILDLDDGKEWRVGIAQVTLSDETIVSGQPVVGARAIVWGRPGEGGTVEAIYIDVLDSRPLPYFPHSHGP